MFGDGSIYRYPSGLVDLVAVRAATTHGYRFNLPSVRRRNRAPWLPYERLESLPGDLLEIYSEPPYDALGPIPACPPPFPDLLFTDLAFQAFQLLNLGCSTPSVAQVDPSGVYRSFSCGIVGVNTDGTFFRFFLDVGSAEATWIQFSGSPAGVYDLETSWPGWVGHPATVTLSP